MTVEDLHAQLSQALAQHGLRLRGSWAPTATDQLPALPDGSAPGVVWMVGVVGSAFWPHFQASSFYSDGLPDPLDRWSRAIGEDLAARYGGVALYPFDGPPYHPFQRWADRAEATQPSALMLRIHPEYGLWHAYRFALALPRRFAGDQGHASQDEAATGASQTEAPGAPQDTTTPWPSSGLCAACSGQPCLQACPVQAYSGSAFAVQACASHLHSGEGEACMQGGCLARNACPVAAELRYSPEHAAFHMRAFAQRH